MDESKPWSALLNRRFAGIGTARGMSTNEASLRLRKLPTSIVASRIGRALAPRSVPKIVRSKIVNERCAISRLMAMTRVAETVRCQSASAASIASVIWLARPRTALCVNEGWMRRRWRRQSAPSLVASPTEGGPHLGIARPFWIVRRVPYKDVMNVIGRARECGPRMGQVGNRTTSP